MVLNKIYKYDDTIVNINYIAEPNNENINEENDIKVVDRVFDNNYFIDLEQIIIVLRTVFKNYTEQMLSICVEFENDLNSVTFENGNLKEYKNFVAVNHNDKNCGMLKIAYIGDELNFSVPKQFTNISEHYSTNKQVYNFFDQETSYITRLLDMNLKGLSKDQKILNLKKQDNLLK